MWVEEYAGAESGLAGRVMTVSARNEPVVWGSRGFSGFPVCRLHPSEPVKAKPCAWPLGLSFRCLSLGTRKTRGGQSRRQDITGQQAGKMKARRPCLAVGHSILLMGV